MNKPLALAVLLLATGSAHAGSFAFDVDGHRVKVAVPRHCADLSCLSVSTSGFSTDDLKSGTSDLGGLLAKFMPGAAGQGSDDDAPAPTTRETAPAQQAAIPAAPQAQPLPQAQPAPMQQQAVQPVAPAPVAQPAPQTAAAAPLADQTQPIQAAPALSEAQPVAPAPVQQQPTSVTRQAALPTAEDIARPDAIAAPSAQPAPMASAQTPEPSPLGVWKTEKREGRVHIVPCGPNLCGYAIKEATGEDGTKILIDMRPVSATKWSGKIHDPRQGGTYMSTLTLKSGDTLRVQGCAFGGMICGGQTWSRG